MVWNHSYAIGLGWITGGRVWYGEIKGPITPMVQLVGWGGWEWGREGGRGEGRGEGGLTDW